MTDKIAKKNLEELEAERARYDNTIKEILEVNMEKTTKLTKSKKKIEKLKEQIKKLKNQQTGLLVSESS